ncbi:hypothetical protein [Tuberibacillus sp. Marseille-P3662]|uniref:hypothetical protein n=1 Tax=Tuberibacillus sp. Marseille-P3662 TaxID=1965358 RepID=UPI00111C8AC7|nr:hypothetical protein [Tuberibacillus sp. Marseille-P3662]
MEKLLDYQGKNVKVNFGGPESRSGRLLIVKSDYLAINTERDGVCYYQLKHVKGVSIDSKDHSRTSGRHNHCYEENDFVEILRCFKHKRIKINRGGPESIEGVLNNIFDHHLEVTINDEIIFVSIYHIKSVSQISNSKHSGHRRSSHGTGHRKSHRTGHKHSSGSKVYDAMKKADKSGTRKYMYNDPSESSHSSHSKGKKSSRRSQESKGERPHWHSKQRMLRGGWIKLS